MAKLNVDNKVKTKKLTTKKIKADYTREERIKNCTTCKGNPPESDINLPDWEGKKCTTCYEVIHATKK